ncbi:Hypothetical predicted protein [Cloeon dipterum]|uniref:PSI domain-containing protein n=1 Tax=Cloeon dipterum TaxID=197152 RepID=A0A8S1DF10_9INSE|nr:Hypothetical predicted protein [Cloeon dipterum]
MLLTGTFLLSLTSTLDTDQKTKPVAEQEIWDDYNSFRIKYIPVDADYVQKSWDIVEHNKKSFTKPYGESSFVVFSPKIPFYATTIMGASLTRSGAMLSYQLEDFKIAPLFAINASSSYTFLKTADGSFHINWENFLLKGAKDEDKMKFQASLFKNGTIEFVYMKMPEESVLKAYAATYNISIVVLCHFKEIFRNGFEEAYRLGHSIDMNKFKIQNGTVIRFDPLPSCPKYEDCKSCVNVTVLKDLKITHPCFWCPKLRICSSKKDYFQNAWTRSGCGAHEVSDPLNCLSSYADVKAKWFNKLKPFFIIAIMAPACFSIFLWQRTFFVSLTSTFDTNLAEQDIWDEYNSLRIKYIPVDEDLAQKSWNVVEQNKNSKTETNRDRLSRMVYTSFKFPFYEELLSVIFVLRSGGISTLFLDEWLIAPLHDINARSIYKYLDTGDSFHVNWENFILKDARDEDGMRFQASLFKNGTIQFVYMKIPQQSALTAYTATNNISIVVRYSLKNKFHTETEIEKNCCQLGYSIDLNNFKIQNGTVIRFEPLPSCTKYKDCQSCVNATVPKDLRSSRQCVWCPKKGICSSKNDYLEKAWKRSGCEAQEVSDTLTCISPYRAMKAKWLKNVMTYFIIVIIAVLFISSLKHSINIIYKMRKALFYHGLMFLSGSFVVSLTSTLDTDNETQSDLEQDIWDEYNSLRITYIPVDEEFAQKSWDVVENSRSSTTDPNSESHLVFLTLSFPYSENQNNEISVTRSGEILSFYYEDWLISPLYAFNASSIYKFLDTGDSFHVNWENFLLNDARDEDGMRFQASLFKNGTIQFVYMKIPQQSEFIDYAATNNISIVFRYNVETILRSDGFEEAYQFGHSIDINKFKIQNGTVIRFDPLPSCPKYKDCQSCVNATVPTDLNNTRSCVWCPKLRICSSKNDHHRNAWIRNGCEAQEVSDPLNCLYPAEIKSKWVFEWTDVYIIVIAVICFFSLKHCRPSEIRSRMRSIMLFPKAPN